MVERPVPIAEIKTSWRDAEARLKRTEIVEKQISQAALNQLRYAGYHLIEALSAEEDAEASEQYAKFKRHCERAAYDAIEAEVLVYLEVLKAFQQTFSAIPIEVSGFDYLAIRALARRAQQAISRARADNESRQDFYRALDMICVEFAEGIAKLEDVREELKKRLESKEGEQRRFDADAQERKRVQQRWLWGFAITGFVSLVIGLANAGFSAVLDRLVPPPASNAAVVTTALPSQ